MASRLPRKEPKQPIIYQMTTPTDTPRTDAELDVVGGIVVVWPEFARQLERELASVKADNFDLANALSKAEAESVCLQELIQKFYEWSRRDFPTEQEVREIMNRYYDLLNK